MDYHQLMTLKNTGPKYEFLILNSKYVLERNSLFNFELARILKSRDDHFNIFKGGNGKPPVDDSKNFRHQI